MMNRLERIIEDAQRLPANDRRKLVAALTKALRDGDGKMKPAKRPRATAKSQRPKPYAALLDVAGTAHSRYHDVSTDKYKHLAEIYYDRHEGA